MIRHGQHRRILTGKQVLLACIGVFIALAVTGGAIAVTKIQFLIAVPEAPKQLKIERAAERGTMIRVIVTLRVPNYAPSNTAAVAAVQDKVLADLASSGVRLERKYANLPQMVVIANMDGLRRLRSHPDVVQAEEDSAVPPAR